MSEPQQIDLVIEADWIVPVQPADSVLENHAVAIDDGRILDVLPASKAAQQYQARSSRKLDGHVLVPGLINLHTHAAMTLFRGLADDLALMDWLSKHIWPAEGRHISEQFIFDGTLLACSEMLKSGITCFNDMYFFPEQAGRAALECGMRAVLGIVLIEFPTPVTPRTTCAKVWLRVTLSSPKASSVSAWPRTPPTPSPIQASNR
jgi:5-methylthioadenosine/S-adenosylhomocysteine deaminase